MRKSNCSAAGGSCGGGCHDRPPSCVPSSKPPSPASQPSSALARRMARGSRRPYSGCFHDSSFRALTAARAPRPPAMAAARGSAKSATDQSAGSRSARGVHDAPLVVGVEHARGEQGRGLGDGPALRAEEFHRVDCGEQQSLVGLPSAAAIESAQQDSFVGGEVRALLTAGCPAAVGIIEMDAAQRAGHARGDQLPRLAAVFGAPDDATVAHCPTVLGIGEGDVVQFGVVEHRACKRASSPNRPRAAQTAPTAIKSASGRAKNRRGNKPSMATP